MSRLSRIWAVSAVSELFRPLAPNGERKKVVYLLNLTKLHVYEQLLLEECLYRMSSPLTQGENNVGFVLINDTYSNAKEEERGGHGSIPSENKCVVFGISGKVPNFIKDVEYIGKNKIALIRRYTGGGTVYIRNNCVMFSLILPLRFEVERQLYPSNVTEWVFNSFYHSVFNSLSGEEEKEKKKNPNIFSHHENDYVHIRYDHVHDEITMRKVGGNAQAFSKNYFVHHTSFLWSCDYDEMERVIVNPLKQPQYRNRRSHRDFLTSLEECLPGAGHTPVGFIGKFVSNIRRLINQKNGHNDQNGGPFWQFNKINLGIHQDCLIGSGGQIFDEVHSVEMDIWKNLFRSFCSSEETKNMRSTRLLDPLGGVLSDDAFCGPSFILR
ncbi:lipoate-protein ligase A [Plasmodium inui San Antonio 1]|uniref:Lipoate-protein ligase A n=1 Tax=Plasmodium inui San Antonio 1 TaxID=1237626 RepID=W7AGE9_9APIC|nr:lipoate-protein ligase A [Plasmodium inui San Antonio 1]EUD68059.1 lipoate-protein ligase A [Plasmodium inui San Antonio 1]